MKGIIVRLFKHLNLALLLFFLISRKRISRRATRFVFNYKLLKFILDFKEIDLFKLRTVIDGGANRGHFSQTLLRLNPNISIYAFEPLATKEYSELVDSCYASLEKLKVRYNNFHYSSDALSDTESIEVFNVTTFDECSSLLK